ncbi:MAG TPA: hypothetical protein VJH55_02795 [Candidatus Paceibacterota bacterium]
MIRLLGGPKFEKDVKDTPKDVRVKLAILLEFLQRDPFDPRLHIKKLKEPFEGVFSFRITRDWRVMFKFLAPREILLLHVKHRKDIYR